MGLNRKGRRTPIIPINSMSDIAFLLLIFIMLISLMNYRKEIKIDYPEASFHETTQADLNLEVWVTREGVLYYKNKIIDLKSLELVISDAVAKRPKTRVHVIADRKTHYKYVNGIMDLLKLLQHRSVSLVVKGEEQ